ncbi:hypothetical protein AUK15_01910 [Candidatus Nomurabacteria bacterium CG2_30_43_9]|uniref:Uncharacterized protein n=1 Tax=Candidatus Nomurabacteria bacterium CG2_30_43_9 TaxID=1805283 RepID=A0A1J5FYG2_9BACT|nr:MAG: hypothetical protein AUK15_01910 [Candidatus Nomurabacteria bacterium CG2_30_43_9]
MVEHLFRVAGLRGPQPFSAFAETSVERWRKAGKLRDRVRGRWFESIHPDHFSNEMVMYKNKKTRLNI